MEPDKYGVSLDDYHMQVSNAGFGDMLQDWERNQKYFAALRKTINEMHENGETVNVLDIGTGTGILAMMAVAAGADSVTACESFRPMADCAEKIIADNGMADKIQVIKYNSKNITIGDDKLKQMKQRANLLVAEVLDTELIGEGAISIYNHAHKELLTDSVRCIPARAFCYAQVVESSLRAQWTTIKDVVSSDGVVLIEAPNDVLNCKGPAGLHDVQLSQFPLDKFSPLTKPVRIFKFDFSSKEPFSITRRSDLLLKTIRAGSTDLVFFWWSIDMDFDATIQLSLAPYWAHPDYLEQTDYVKSCLAAGKPAANSIPWRDHWMQAIYYIPRPLHLNKIGMEFNLSCYHDEFSFWFDAYTGNFTPPHEPRYHCNCSLHRLNSRTRIAQMNDAVRNKRYLRIFEETIQPAISQVLVLSENCMIGLAACVLQAFNVYFYEPQEVSRLLMISLARRNNIDNLDYLEGSDKIKDVPIANISHIFAEPHFILSILPWDDFYFGRMLRGVVQNLPEGAQVVPHSAFLYAVAVEFLDLHRIAMPVGTCESFDLSRFDKLVAISTAISQPDIDAKPLWEYPCRALSQQHEVLRVSFEDFNVDQAIEGTMDIEFDGSCNGVAMWINYPLDKTGHPRSIICNGPTEDFAPGEYIKWNMFVRQGVHLIRKPKNVKVGENKVHYACNFNGLNGAVDLKFRIINS